MTVALSSHSQNRRVGPRVPAATWSSMSSSSATLTRVGRGPGWMISHSWSVKSVPPDTARRTATATSLVLKPCRATSSIRARALSIRACSSAVVSLIDAPSSAGPSASYASSGSRKKSPDTWVPVIRPSSTETSTTTSLPWGTLISK